MDVQTGSLHGPNGSALPNCVASAVVHDDDIIAGPEAHMQQKHRSKDRYHTALCGDERFKTTDLGLADEDRRPFDRLGVPRDVNQAPEEEEVSPGRLSGHHGDRVLGDMGLALWLPHGS